MITVVRRSVIIVCPRKKCGQCGLLQLQTEFHRDKYSSDGLRNRCKYCIKSYDDARRDERNQRARTAYAEDPRPKIDQSRQYHLDHPEWSKERLRVHHVKHRAERYERHVQRGLDPVIASKRRESSRRSESRRRALKLTTQVDVISEFQFLCRLQEFNHQCYICGVELTTNLHWDHYRPLTAGGAHTLDNLFPACDLCNIRKSNCWPFTEERKREIAKSVLALRKQQVQSQGRR